MLAERLKLWFKNYTLVMFMILVFFGWLIIWGAWMLFIVIMNPN